VDACVAVAVGDVEVTTRADGQLRRLVEGRSAVGNGPVVGGVARLGRPARRAHGQDELAFGRELTDSVVADVHAVDEPGRVERDGVRHAEEPVSEGPDEGTVALIDEDRMIAAARALPAVEHVDAVLGVNRHADHIGMAPTGRQLLPALGHFIA
jgi:hypothetical protein